MTLVTATVEDVHGGPDNSVWIFSSLLRESSDGNEIITPKTVRVTPIDGSLSITLDPGFSAVAYRGKEYVIEVPESGTADLWDLISASVSFPPGTPPALVGQAVLAYLGAHPFDGGTPADAAWTIQSRRGTKAQWASANPVLLIGEAGYETNTNRIKYGDGTTAWNSLAYAGIELYYDVRRSGAKCDGTTDDTAAWADAVSKVSTAGGGMIWWAGTTIVSQIELRSKVGLLGLGLGASVIKQKAGRADGLDCILLDEASALSVVMRDFTVDGNKANQTSGSGAGIHMDNNAGVDGTQQVFHQIRNVVIRNVKGDGLYWGYGMRGSVVDGVNTYACDGYGIHGANFTDSTMLNVDVGRSGLDGIYLDSCKNSRFSNLKSWYSGEVVAGGRGIYVRNGETCMMSNISTQENSGHGMHVYGQGDFVYNMTLSGYASDSDNTQGTTSNYGLVLNNVINSTFDVTVTSKAPLASTPFSGVDISVCTGCKVVAHIDPTAVTWPITGSAIGANEIELCRGVAASTPTGSLTPSVYANREHWVTLTANRTISNPSTSTGNPLVGVKFRFVLIQDATGGRVVSWSSAYKIPASVRFDTAASSRTIIDFECIANGDWQMVGLHTDKSAIPTVVGSIDFGATTDATITRSAAGKIAVEGVEVMDVGTIHALTSKTTPVDADEFVIVDSAASNGLKKSAWSDLKTTLFSAVAGVVTLVQSATIQAFNTSDQTTNYERARGFWSADVFNLKTENGGTGTIRDLVVGASTIAVATFKGAGNFARIALVANTSAATGISVQQAGTLNASSGVQRGLLANPTINQTSTAGYTALGVDVVETATGSGAKKLIDAAVGGTSKFSVDNAGNAVALGSFDLGHASDTTVSRLSAGQIGVEGNPVATKVAVPASASAAGAVGQYAVDASFHYDCIATNTWVRSAVATW